MSVKRQGGTHLEVNARTGCDKQNSPHHHCIVLRRRAISLLLNFRVASQAARRRLLLLFLVPATPVRYQFTSGALWLGWERIASQATQVRGAIRYVGRGKPRNAHYHPCLMRKLDLATRKIWCALGVRLLYLKSRGFIEQHKTVVCTTMKRKQPTCPAVIIVSEIFARKNLFLGYL